MGNRLPIVLRSPPYVGELLVADSDCRSQVQQLDADVQWGDDRALLVISLNTRKKTMRQTASWFLFVPRALLPPPVRFRTREQMTRWLSEQSDSRWLADSSAPFSVVSVVNSGMRYVQYWGWEMICWSVSSALPNYAALVSKLLSAEFLEHCPAMPSVLVSLVAAYVDADADCEVQRERRCVGVFSPLTDDDRRRQQWKLKHQRACC